MIDKESFVERAKEKFGDKFDYSKSEYVKAYHPITIMCPLHGEFETTPSFHIKSKHGCPKCSVLPGEGRAEELKERFVRISNEVHKGKYGYSEVEFYNSLREKVSIVCPVHGEFKQSAQDHMKGKGCLQCAGSAPLTKEDFVRRSRLVHGDKYDYSEAEYRGNKNKVKIICPDHGEFWQKAGHHMDGFVGCKDCVHEGSSMYRHKIYKGFGESNLYLVRLKQDEKTWLKVGISVDPVDRFSRFQTKYQMEHEIIRVYTGLARECYEFEKYMLHRCGIKRYMEEEWDWHGRSECFSEESLKSLERELDFYCDYLTGVFRTK